MGKEKKGKRKENPVTTTGKVICEYTGKDKENITCKIIGNVEEDGQTYITEFEATAPVNMIKDVLKSLNIQIHATSYLKEPTVQERLEM